MNERVSGPGKIGRREVLGKLEQMRHRIEWTSRRCGIRWRVGEKEKERREKVENVMEVKSRTKDERRGEGK